MTLTILGLGPGDVNDLTRKAWRALETAKTVYLRTNQHPCVPHLPQGIVYHSFDSVYDTVDDFAAVYTAIVERVLAAEEALSGGVGRVMIGLARGKGAIAQARTGRGTVFACGAVMS